MAAGGAGAGLGFGTYSFIEGNLKRDYTAALPDVWKATVEALDSLEITSKVQAKDALVWHVRV